MALQKAPSLPAVASTGLFSGPPTSWHLSLQRAVLRAARSTRPRTCGTCALPALLAVAVPSTRKCARRRARAELRGAPVHGATLPQSVKEPSPPARRRLSRPQVPTRLMQFPDEGANFAFMFVKPHANTEEGRGLVQEELRRRGIEVLKQGEIGADDIEARSIIDTHYGSLATRALKQAPSELLVKPDAQEAFRAAFGLSWQEALERDLVCNAQEAMRRLACSGEALEALWAPLRFGEGKVKLGSGCYAGSLRGLFVINGFYLVMRSMYTQPGSSVHYYMLRFRSQELSWADFRRELLGHTDPALAAPESLRGHFLRRWRELGLKSEPHTGENAVHASASPLEALAERLNWLQLGPQELLEDSFAQQLLRRGVKESSLQHWLSDPPVRHGGRSVPAFDLFEDRNTDECLQLAQQLAHG